MFRLATSGPEAPFGRSAMSTRKVKPSSMISDSAAISFLPRRVKNSWFDSWRWPGAVTRGVAVFRVDEDQVDVGRDVQFAAALLAHRQHHHFLRPARFVRRSACRGWPPSRPSARRGGCGSRSRPGRSWRSTTSARSAWPSRSRRIRPQTSRLRRRRMARGKRHAGRQFARQRLRRGRAATAVRAAISPIAAGAGRVGGDPALVEARFGDQGRVAHRNGKEELKCGYGGRSMG